MSTISSVPQACRPNPAPEGRTQLRLVDLGAAQRQTMPDAVREWLDAEQKLLSRAVNTQRIISPELNQQGDAYKPETGNILRLQSYWVDADKVHALRGEGLPDQLENLFIRTENGKQQYRLVVHPESKGFYEELVKGAEPAGTLFGTPTSSSRTMLVWDKARPNEPFFAKLSLDQEIGGVVRTIPRSETARSIGVSNVLHRDPPIDGFSYTPEVFSLIPEGAKRGGMILRTIPDEVVRGEERVVPLFSLYANPPEGGPPMLARMIEESGVDAETFMRERIISPFLRQWFELAVKRGITHEPHAQNVLMRTDPDGLPDGRFMYRDLGGFDIHFNHRDRLQLETRAHTPVLGTLEDDYHQSETRKHLTNVEVFFVQGFLYNVEKALPEWKEKGWLSGPLPAPDALRQVIRSEMSALFREHTGRDFDVGADLRHLASYVTDAREHEAKQGVLDWR